MASYIVPFENRAVPMAVGPLRTINLVLFDSILTVILVLKARLMILMSPLIGF